MLFKNIYNINLDGWKTLQMNLIYSIKKRIEINFKVYKEDTANTIISISKITTTIF